MAAKPKHSPGYGWARKHVLSSPAAQAAWAFQEKLERSQWHGTREHAAYQLGHLQRLLRHAQRETAYYSDLFRRAEFDPDAQFDWNAWRRLPLLTRRQVQDNKDQLRAKALPRGHGKPIEMRTSGSTGSPVVTYASDFTEHWHKVLTARYQLWSLRRFDRKLAIIRKYRAGDAEFPEGALADRWVDEAALPVETGVAVLLNTSASIQQHAEWLDRHQPDVLFIAPSNLAALLALAEAEHLGLPRLKRIQTFGETLSAETRQAAKAVWGVDVYDFYSAQETGYIALQCPDTTAYHVPAECILVEVLDDDGKPCAPCNTGRVVVTPLFGFAMPLIRYDIGDYAEVGRPCRCGRGLPALTRVLGRRRNIMVLPDGSQHWPSFGTRRFTEIAPILQHQFIQSAPSELEVRLVTARRLSDAEEKAFCRHVVKRLPYPFDLKVSYVEDIPRSESGKFEDFVSHVRQEDF